MEIATCVQSSIILRESGLGYRMANKRKDSLREKIRKLKGKMTYKEIAKEVGLPDRQWVYYYMKKD